MSFPENSPVSLNARKNASILLALIFALVALLVAGQKLLDSRAESVRAAALTEAVSTRAKGAALAFAKALYEDWQRATWTAARIEGLSTVQRQEAIEALVSSPGRVGWAGYTDTSGRVLAASGGLLVGADVSERPWFKGGLQAPYVGDVHEALLLQRFLGKSGEEPLRFLDFAVPTLGPDGEVTGVLCLHIEVAWAQSYLREIAATLGLDLALVDPSGLIAIDASQSATMALPKDLNTLALKEAQLVEWSDGGRYYTAVFPQFSIGDMPSFGWRLVARIDPAILSETTLPAGRISRLLTDEAETLSLRAVLWTLAVFAVLLGGAAVFFSSNARQASSQTQTALARLATTEQKFLALFGNASLPIAVIRGDVYKTVNEAAARLLGYEKTQDLEGKTFLQLSPEVQADGLLSTERFAAIEAELAQRGNSRFDWLHLKADGSAILLNVILTEVQTEAGREVFAVWSDVTARRKAEETVRDYQNRLERAVIERTEQLEAAHSELKQAKDQSDQLAKLRSDFLATMSHEIRGPLNSLIGFVELASEDPSNKQQAGFLNKAIQSGRHLASIVDDILDLTRAEAGRLQLETVEFDLIDMAHSALEAIEPAVRNKPLELLFDACPDLPATITADPLRLRQILMNYLTNAAKFTQSGVIVLGLQRVEREGTSYLRFSVEDTGIGLGPEQKERLFRSFSQADVSTARLYGGSGLGLAICQQLATLMEGEVGFTSEAGKGSCFWFDLPCEGHVTTNSVLAHPAAGNGKVVWLGMSDDRLRDVLRAWLERAGFEVHTIGAQAPPSSAVVLYDEKTAAEVKWLAEPVPSNTYFIGSKNRGSGRSTSRIITTPVNPRKLLARLLPSDKMGEAVNVAKEELLPYAQGLSVLVADDDELNRDLAKSRLSRMGFSVQTASNGAEALQAVLDHRFDLILMDHQMPGIDGIEATRRIRALSQSRSEIPIIGVSGSDRPEVRRACELAGMNSFLLKPLTNAKLHEVLKTVVAR